MTSHQNTLTSSSSSDLTLSSPSVPSTSSFPWTMEVLKAVNWWKSQLCQNGSVPMDKANVFEKRLLEGIVKKIQNHWFVEEPARGQAYRSISLDILGRPDPLLQVATLAANITNLHESFPYIESLTMWIDPGLVAVKTYWTYAKAASEEVIYMKPYALESNSRNATKKPLPPQLQLYPDPNQHIITALRQKRSSVEPMSSSHTNFTQSFDSSLTIKSNLKEARRADDILPEDVLAWWDTVNVDSNVLSIRA